MLTVVDLSHHHPDVTLNVLVGFLKKEIRPVNETKMRARWMLGQALSKVERNVTGRPSKKSDAARPTFQNYIKSIGLKKQSAQQAQRLGALPKPELEKAFAQSRENDVLNTLSGLIDRARHVA